MKAPPFLLGATLLFWGWQTDHVLAGAIMAGLLESARWVKSRWEFTDQDFRRIWIFCALLLLAAAVYAFTSSGAPGDFVGVLQDPSFSNQRIASASGANAVAVWFRSLPMVFLLFVAAQTYNLREGIPPETISLLLRWRWYRPRKLAGPAVVAPNVNVSFAYFALCLFAATFRVREDDSFFWGLSGLLAWAFWSLRSRRFGMMAWAGALAGAVVMGYYSQVGLGELYRFVEGHYPSWFTRAMDRGADPMRSKTALGHIGRLKASTRIVIRLEPKEGSRAPNLLREASYRTYRSGTWYADSARDSFEPVIGEPDQTTWTLLPGTTNSAGVNLACYLPGGIALLPLPAGSGRLENLSAFTLQKNPLGAVLAQGPGLVVFDAFYGPGESIDSPASTNEDLAVPDRETNALNQVIAELHLQPQDRRQALRALAAFFQSPDKFQYRTWQQATRPRSTNETALSRFLLRTRAGHCEYFATATVLLLRQLGIPARYAVGYAVHEASGRKYVVRLRDAHSWCLVWNEATRSWQDFDTTPASWIKAESLSASVLQALSDFWSWLGFEFSKFRWGQTHLRQYFLWALVPILALLLYQIVFRRRSRQSARASTRPGAAALWPGLDSEFYRIERRMAERGAGRQLSEPPTVWLRRVMNDPALADLQDQLRGLLRLHYCYRFDPRGLTDCDREALRREAENCLARIG